MKSNCLINAFSPSNIIIPTIVSPGAVSNVSYNSADCRKSAGVRPRHDMTLAVA